MRTEEKEGWSYEGHLRQFIGIMIVAAAGPARFKLNFEKIDDEDRRWSGLVSAPSESLRVRRGKLCSPSSSPQPNRHDHLFLQVVSGFSILGFRSSVFSS
ncbi:hypothetical protein PIB30_055767 [Stylosanthes scabra]|uniref:Uncharacterized protein n=1 Tax=Stylosanthes scabra TaxID=79078 RepID=A0ABU6XJG5_9FABA|nr:hypothetical protein [Stylosanthes scabra]